MHIQEKLSLGYIYNNVINYKNIDEDINRNMKMDIMYKKKNKR